MWNRGEGEGEHPRQPAAPVAASSEAPKGVATLGPSISIKGTLSGEEDVVIEGRLEGEVALHQQSVTIGRTGRVRADVYGSSICVEGEVQGNLFGEEQVIIRQSGKVRGNVTAPRVNLENGAKFKGAIDMQPASAKSSSGVSKDRATEASAGAAGSAARGSGGKERRGTKTASSAP